MDQQLGPYVAGPNERRIANAQWTPPDEAAARFAYQPGSFWIGRNPINDDDAIGFDDDRHVLLVAGTRSGKGRAIIVNNLALWPGSIVSIDPKGENATLTARRRGPGSEHCDGLGQDVYVLDPFGTVDKSRVGADLRAFYNPLVDMDPNDPELPRFAARIAESMMFNINKNDPSWDKKGGSMIEALIMHVVTSPDFDASERHLVTVRKLLMAGDYKAIAALKEHGVQDLPSPIEMLWQAVVENQACDGILSDMGSSFLHSCRSNMRYFDSVKTSAEDQTKWIDSRGVRDVLSGQGDTKRSFSLDELKDNPNGISVYLCLPQADMATYARWQRMMVDLMIAAMQKTQTKPKNGHRVLFSLDEFAGLGKMDRIRTASAEVAGAGVKLFIAVQGLNQLEEVYEKGWETFVGNAGLQLFFDMKENFTLDYLQKALGETEVIRTTQTTNETINSQTSRGTTESTSTGTSKTSTRGGHTGWNKSRTVGSNWNKAFSRGVNESRGTNSGHSHSRNFGPWSFFNFLAESENRGNSSGRNQSHGTQSGTTESRGGNKAQTSGTAGGNNWSDSSSENRQYQAGSQYTEAHGQASGVGTAQSIHKRHLLSFDEANKLFSRIDDEEHLAFPGLLIARIAGQDPMIVRRVNYDQDPTFARCFDPHPDHDFIPWVDPGEIASKQLHFYQFYNHLRHIEYRYDDQRMINFCTSVWDTGPNTDYHLKLPGHLKLPCKIQQGETLFDVHRLTQGKEVCEKIFSLPAPMDLDCFIDEDFQEDPEVLNWYGKLLFISRLDGNVEDYKPYLLFFERIVNLAVTSYMYIFDNSKRIDDQDRKIESDRSTAQLNADRIDAVLPWKFKKAKEEVEEKYRKAQLRTWVSYRRALLKRELLDKNHQIWMRRLENFKSGSYFLHESFYVSEWLMPDRKSYSALDDLDEQFERQLGGEFQVKKGQPICILKFKTSDYKKNKTIEVKSPCDGYFYPLHSNHLTFYDGDCMGVIYENAGANDDHQVMEACRKIFITVPSREDLGIISDGYEP